MISKGIEVILDTIARETLIARAEHCCRLARPLTKISVWLCQTGPLVADIFAWSFGYLWSGLSVAKGVLDLLLIVVIVVIYATQNIFFSLFSLISHTPAVYAGLIVLLRVVWSVYRIF
jgi:hypothetical protein